jgi:hypothetical protein
MLEAFMPRSVRVTCLAIVLASCVGGVSLKAWNDHGHMMVAFLAYQQLSAVPAVKAKVDALVKLNPLIAKWNEDVASLPVELRPAALFAIAATWADIIKSDNTYHDDGPSGGNRPPPDQSAFANIGYSDKARHKYWHFIDTPFATDQTPLPPVPNPHSVERIPVFRKVLASPTAPQALKSYDLMWILHIVGDMHQPLHDVTRVSQSQPRGDDGGNGVRVCAMPCNDRLHLFWDGVLGDDKDPVGLFNDATSFQVATGPNANVLDPKKWADEGFMLARSDVYRAPIGNGAGPFTINLAYMQNAQRLAKERIALAAARLANILKADLQ